MIYCVTIIIVVALICATRLYPLWLRHDRKRYRELERLLKHEHKENIELRDKLKQAYDEWLSDFGERQKQLSEIYDNIYEITEKLNTPKQ